MPRGVLTRFFIVPEPDDGAILSGSTVLTSAELSVLTFTTAQPSTGSLPSDEKKIYSTTRAQFYQTGGEIVDEFVDSAHSALNLWSER